MSSATRPYRSALPPGREGFLALLHAEWTKFRTVRGWIGGAAGTTLLLVLLAVLAGASSPSPRHGPRPSVPIGPGGEAASDSFYFVHQTLSGDGSITAPVTTLHVDTATVPWAKAGLIIKDGTTPGSPYAALMVTSGHGVRLQWDFTGDVAGLPGRVSAATPRWLRLDRSSEVITGYDSTDGVHWAKVGSVRIGGLSATVQAGLFVASPSSVHGYATGVTVATAAFGPVDLRGDWPQDGWSAEQVGADSASFSGYPPSSSGGFVRSGGAFTVVGAGTSRLRCAGPCRRAASWATC